MTARMRKRRNHAALPAFTPFVSVGEHGRFADWVRTLRGHSGVYMIRDLGGRLLYIGESHRRRLYETLTRHFQEWSGDTAGPTYHRGRVEVSVAVLPPKQAIEVQDHLILALAPLDNRTAPALAEVTVDVVPEDDVPF